MSDDRCPGCGAKFKGNAYSSACQYNVAMFDCGSRYASFSGNATYETARCIKAQLSAANARADRAEANLDSLLVAVNRVTCKYRHHGKKYVDEADLDLLANRQLDVEAARAKEGE